MNVKLSMCVCSPGFSRPVSIGEKAAKSLKTMGFDKFRAPNAGRRFSA